MLFLGGGVLQLLLWTGWIPKAVMGGSGDVIFSIAVALVVYSAVTGIVLIWLLRGSEPSGSALGNSWNLELSSHKSV
jgi:hypothetical protein